MSPRDGFRNRRAALEKPRVESTREWHQKRDPHRGVVGLITFGTWKLGEKGPVRSGDACVRHASHHTMLSLSDAIIRSFESE